jgi:G:T-mismatch repair DNA endonuclease (very short patch repair protein)
MRYWEYISTDELQKIRTKAGETLKEMYRSGEIVHKSKTDPEWEEDCKSKRLEGYRKWLDQSDSVFHGAESRQEKEIAKALEQENIKYKKQFKLKKDKYYYFYDYLLIDHNIIIEYNGTYWHCDPRKYSKEHYNLSKKMYAHQIWERDLEKKLLAEQNGYDMIVLWEEDYRSLTNKEFLEKTLEAVKNKINQKIKS